MIQNVLVQFSQQKVVVYTYESHAFLSVIVRGINVCLQTCNGHLITQKYNIYNQL